MIHVIPDVMSVLVSAHNLSKSFGAKVLFQNLAFGIETGQKIGLIGPNGAGKSTLLKIVAGIETPDSGEIKKSRGLVIGHLAQSPQFHPEETVYDAIAGDGPNSQDAHHIRLVYELIAKLELDSMSHKKAVELSGGWQKRAALARELVKNPQLLLLDEPTNHLDVESILWLEEFLANQTSLALLTVTHDRLFLEKTSDLIFDLDIRNPDGLIKFNGAYADFLEHKESVVEGLKSREQTQKNTLRRETEWLRRGAKARQTKQKARIERAGALADEVEDLKARNAQRTIAVNFGDFERAPKKMIEAKGIGQNVDGRWLFRDFSLTLGPGARVGLLGRNGTGKTTLIRTLIGELAPTEGTVFISDLVKISYFAQKKESLDPNMPVIRAIAPEGGDYVHLQGQPVFARSYLSRFLFRGDQMDLPVGKLSGGEQSRLLIARMMLNAESVLVLDEPTNDLDIATLDVLENALAEFRGAVLLVTHDRYFMDHVANQIYAFEDGIEGLTGFADYFQWEEWKKQLDAAPKKSTSVTGTTTGEPTKKVKLSYKEQREWDSMETAIAEADAKLDTLKKQLDEPSLQSDYTKLQEVTNELQSQQDTVDKLYARWEELSKKQGL